MRFAIGTTNPGKVREIGAILSATGHEFDTVELIDVPETAPDFRGNARLKALAWARHAKIPTISEDSGLVIPALNDLPGAMSARFSECELELGNGRNGLAVRRHRASGLSRDKIDANNNALVLELLTHFGCDDVESRAATLIVVLNVASPSGEILFSGQGESSGSIAPAPKGSNGFGYDPIFIGNDTFGSTYAELDAMRKNLRSHRKAVLDQLKAWLRTVQ